MLVLGAVTVWCMHLSISQSRTDRQGFVKASQFAAGFTLFGFSGASSVESAQFFVSLEWWTSPRRSISGGSRRLLVLGITTCDIHRSIEEYQTLPREEQVTALAARIEELRHQGESSKGAA